VGAEQHHPEIRRDAAVVVQVIILCVVHAAHPVGNGPAKASTTSTASAR
jgi:hypothetical protein